MNQRYPANRFQMPQQAKAPTEPSRPDFDIVDLDDGMWLPFAATKSQRVGLGRGISLTMKHISETKMYMRFSIGGELAKECGWTDGDRIMLIRHAHDISQYLLVKSPNGILTKSANKSSNGSLYFQQTIPAEGLVEIARNLLKFRVNENGQNPIVQFKLPAEAIAE